MAREPWWIKRAKYLKREAKPKWKVEDIARELGRTLPEVRVALGMPAQAYKAPIESEREGEPEWAPRARELANGGLSIQKTADELGIPYSRVYRVLHHARKAAADARHAPKYRDRDAELKRARNRRKAKACERCGQKLSSAKVRGPFCQKCKTELWTLKLEEAAELRRSGWTIAEIAERMGQPPTSVSAMLTFARQRGIEVPYQRDPTKEKQ